MYAAANPTNTRYNAYIRTTTHGTVNGENMVIPQQLMTSKVGFISSKISCCQFFIATWDAIETSGLVA